MAARCCEVAQGQAGGDRRGWRRRTLRGARLGWGVVPAWWSHLGLTEVRLGLPSSISQAPRHLRCSSHGGAEAPVSLGRHRKPTSDLGLSVLCLFLLGFL